MNTPPHRQHAVFTDQRPGTYAGWLSELTSLLRDAPEPARERLRRRFYWKPTFPGEWWHPHYPVFQVPALRNASAQAIAHMRAEGFKTLPSGEHLLAFESCVFPRGPGNAEGCATADGNHPTTPVNYALARELLSAVADDWDKEEGE